MYFVSNLSEKCAIPDVKKWQDDISLKLRKYSEVLAKDAFLADLFFTKLKTFDEVNQYICRIFDQVSEGNAMAQFNRALVALAVLCKRFAIACAALCNVACARLCVCVGLCKVPPQELLDRKKQ